MSVENCADCAAYRSLIEDQADEAIQTLDELHRRVTQVTEAAAMLWQYACGAIAGRRPPVPDELAHHVRRVVGDEALARALLRMPFEGES